jgi:hypothetical protein
MNVKGKALIEIELSDKDQIDITLKTLKRVMNWPEDAYIDDASGDLIRDEVCYTSHSFTDHIHIRTATEDDKAFQRILSKFRYSCNILS